MAYKSSLKDSISMVWCGIYFLPGNQASKARFINQKNFKKIQVSSLSYSLKYTKKILRNPETQQSDQREKESRDLDKIGDLPKTYQRRTQKKKKKPRSCAAWVGSARPRSRAAWVSRALLGLGRRAPPHCLGSSLFLFLVFFFFLR